MAQRTVAIQLRLGAAKTLIDNSIAVQKFMWKAQIDRTCAFQPGQLINLESSVDRLVEK